MALVAQFREIESGLADDWEALQLRLSVPDEGDGARAAALLGPLNPGRRGKLIHFLCVRRAALANPERVRALLARLDRERIGASLELGDVHTEATAATEARPRLATAWDAAVVALPPDWSDLFAEVLVTSSDYIEPAALRLSPLNPTRPGSRPLFRFRVARKSGYGAWPAMARRCLERLDEAGIDGELRILNVLSGTQPINTQGPVLSPLGELN